MAEREFTEKEVKDAVALALTELLEQAKTERGDLVVIGCSSSEIAGGVIGKSSVPEYAQAVYEGAVSVLEARGLFLAAQCCEHLNRSLIVERAYADAHGLCRVNAVPQVHAGGSFAACAYARMNSPCAVTRVRAQAGLDIGDTLIGMHLAPVAVPVRLSVRKVGCANLVAARSRLPFVGGERAHYDDALR